MYDIGELERWDKRIREKATEFGLQYYPQEFELCDHNQMLGYMAYSGMPSHYPHWSYGKAYEKLKTLYDYGVSGLPYEMVINSDPAVAYLMRDNSLLLQILTIAHVYAHNDFFRNNFTFRNTRAEYTVPTFKAHSERIRGYIEDPSIGLEKVESLLDAAHALSLQVRRNLAVRKRTPAEARQHLLDASQPREDPFKAIHRRPEYKQPDLNKVPLEPDADLLLFIRDHNPFLSEWEKDALTIVHEEAVYFIALIETKIMNEGWASYWHKQILESLDLSQDLHMEFLVRHNQVVRPVPRGLNPYHLGLRIWEDIRRRYDHPTREEEDELDPCRPAGKEKLFEVRETDRDVAFLRRHLTKNLIRELNLFEHEMQGEKIVVSNIADEDGWRAVKETLLRNVGMNGVPVIEVEDSDYDRSRKLYLAHRHDGRDLDLESAEKTLSYIHQLWQRTVALKTIIAGRPSLLTHGESGFQIKRL